MHVIARGRYVQHTFMNLASELLVLPNRVYVYVCSVRRRCVNPEYFWAANFSPHGSEQECGE